MPRTHSIGTPRSLPWLGAALCLMATLVTCLAPAGSALAQQDRVVAVLTPPGGETNRSWAATSLWHALGQSLEGLVANDPVTGEYTGDGLATSWDHNDDFTVWTFHLREGVQFHYGYGEFTAEDVVHSYNLSAGEDSVSLEKPFQIQDFCIHASSTPCATPSAWPSSRAWGASPTAW